MKILFVSNDPSLFVAESASRVRMRTYAAAIGELHILSSAGKDAKEEKDGNLFLHPIHSLKLFRVSILTHRARVLIKKYDIEIVSAQDPFEHGLAAFRATRGTSAKLHVQVHTDFLSPWFVKSGSWHALRISLLNRYRRKIADRVLPEADGIRVVSERVKASLVARYGTRIPDPAVIPVVVDPIAPVPAQLPSHAFTFALIAVGRLEPEKRTQDILTALKLVIVRYPMVGLFIVGAGRERRRLEKIVHSLSLGEHVIFLGERPDARALMGSAHAFIQASAYEGYGRTLVEAALARVPIITTNVGIVGEVLKDSEEVLSVPVADPIALSRCIIELVEDGAIRQQLPMRAETVVRTHLAAVGDLPTSIAADLRRLISI